MDEFLRALLFEIEFLDTYRPPTKAYVRNLIYHILNRDKIRIIKKYDEQLWRKILMHSYDGVLFAKLFGQTKNQLMIFLIIIIMWMTIFISYILIAGLFKISHIIASLISTLITISVVIFLTLNLVKINKEIVGTAFNDEIKKFAEELILYIKNYFKEHNIDPNRYPLYLRHNDYEGLKYMKKGKNKYIAYVEV